MFYPLRDYVLIEPIEEETIKNGIIIPDNAKDVPNKGVVVSVGPGEYQNGTYVLTNVVVGQIVIFDRYAGSELTVDGKKYRLVKENMIMGYMG